jgi:avermitilol synthase
LFCPLAPNVHPDASSVHEGSVLWARSLGMLPTEQHVRSAHKAKVGWLVARGFPTAMLPGLQLAADWTVLFCMLDDYTEKLPAAAEVEVYLQHLLDLFRDDVAGPSEDPFALGMIDLRKRLLDLGPASHYMRFADRLEELFAGNVAEARNRERAQIPDLASYLQLREITIGLQVQFALAELLEGFSLSSRTRAHPALQRLASHASNIVGWANDLFTYEKEIIEGEMHNLVLVLMNERRLTITEAVAQAVELHDSEVRSFLLEIEQLPSFGVGSAGVLGYVSMLTSWVRGHLDWAQETGRYRPFEDAATTMAAAMAVAPPIELVAAQ